MNNINLKKLKPFFEEDKIILKPKGFDKEEITRMIKIIDKGEVIRNKFGTNVYGATF
jgi:hypothetical protein